MAQLSLRSKRSRGVGEQRNTEEREFRRFTCAKNGARAKIPFLGLSLLPSPTETLATQAKLSLYKPAALVRLKAA